MTSKEPYRPQRIGNLRERVNLVNYTQTGVDPFNSPIMEWATVATVAARVEPLKAEEKIIAGGITAEWDVHVHIRHRDDITPEMRVEHRGHTYGIVGIRNLDERRRFLTIECTAAQ